MRYIFSGAMTFKSRLFQLAHPELAGPATRIATLLLLALLPASTVICQTEDPVAQSVTSAVGAKPDGPTFTIADVPTGRPLRILVYGDMRFTNPSNTTDTAPGVRKWLAEKVGQEKPDLLLLTGDMPFHGSDPKDWKIYEQETASWQAEHLRVYPTIGNHEILLSLPRGLQNYFHAYPQIQNSPWYSLRFGNVYVIALDTTNFWAPGWPQRDWLEAQLAHLPASVDFVFFLFHVPIVADLQTAFMVGIPNPTGLEMRQYLEAQAAKSHAKFVIFNGHIHNYERFEINGITHVITGGGGARPYPIFLRGDQDLYQAHTYPNFNYLMITLEGKHAEAKMYRVVDPYAAEMRLEIKDSFALDAK
jgi:acid phosphatase type 7